MGYILQKGWSAYGTTTLCPLPPQPPALIRQPTAAHQLALSAGGRPGRRRSNTAWPICGRGCRMCSAICFWPLEEGGSAANSTPASNPATRVLARSTTSGGETCELCHIEAIALLGCSRHDLIEKGHLILLLADLKPGVGNSGQRVCDRPELMIMGGKTGSWLVPVSQAFRQPPAQERGHPLFQSPGPLHRE